MLSCPTFFHDWTAFAQPTADRQPSRAEAQCWCCVQAWKTSAGIPAAGGHADKVLWKCVFRDLLCAGDKKTLEFCRNEAETCAPNAGKEDFSKVKVPMHRERLSRPCSSLSHPPECLRKTRVNPVRFRWPHSFSGLVVPQCRVLLRVNHKMIEIGRGSTGHDEVL